MRNDPTIILRRISAELFERSSRIQRYLDQVGPGDSGEYTQLTSTIRAALAGIEQSVTEAFETVRQLSLFSSTSGLTVAYDSLARFSRWFTRAHELLAYLPRQPVAPDTVAALARSFGGDFAKHSPSVMLGSLFNAFEFDFVEILESKIPDLHDILVDKPKNIVLQLAICDRASPLAWSILGHELGHAIDSDTGISQRAVAPFSKASPELRDMVAAWGAEISADFIATSVLGPAPLLALISMSYSLLPLRPTDSLSRTHPPTAWRLQLARQFLPTADSSSSFKAEYDGYAASVDGLSPFIPSTARIPIEKQRPPDVLEHIIKPLAESIIREVEGLKLNRFQTTDASLSRCKNRLDRGLPIGAQGLPRAELRSKIEDFSSATYGAPAQRRQAFSELVSTFGESPLEPGVILAGAFLHRLEVISRYCQDESTTARALCGPLHRLDELISSSIRSSSIHDHLLKS